MTYTRILVAVDGTESGQSVIAHAAALAVCRGVELTGLFIIDTEWVDFIGNDWQSSRNARQEFLDYIRNAQEVQAGKAQWQFENAAAGLRMSTSFHVRAGDPAEVLLKELNSGDALLLVTSEKVFQSCGRPKLKRLARQLVRHAKKPVVFVS